MDPFTPWSLGDIDTYLERSGLRVVYKGGQLSIAGHGRGDTSAVDVILPHLKARRSEVIAMMTEPAAVVARPAAPPARGVVLKAVTDRAGARRVWVLVPIEIAGRLVHGRPEVASRKGGVPSDARYVAVEGDAGWTDLESAPIAKLPRLDADCVSCGEPVGNVYAKTCRGCAYGTPHAKAKAGSAGLVPQAGVPVRPAG